MRPVDRLADQSIIEVTLDAVENRSQRCNCRNAVDVGDVAHLEVANVHGIRRRDLATDSGGPWDGDVNLGRVDIAQIPQVEGGVVRDHTQPVGPQRGRHQLVAVGRRERLESVQPSAHSTEVTVAFHINEHLIARPDSRCVVGGHVAILIRRDVEQCCVPFPGHAKSMEEIHKVGNPRNDDPRS